MKTDRLDARNLARLHRAGELTAIRFPTSQEEALGGTTVGWETYTADAVMTPLFAGLPDDRCQCEHWGYVFEGKGRVPHG